MSSAIGETQQSLPVFIPLLLSALIILLWLIPLAAASLREQGAGAGIGGFFEIIALIATVAAPVAYGWKTRDTGGAVLTGILPFLFVMTVARMVSGGPAGSPLLTVTTITWLVPLCIAGGLEGYFASLHDRRFLGAAIVFAAVWILLFLTGID